MNPRQQFTATVTDLMAPHQDIVLLLGDIGTYGFREAFARFPKRCFNVGPAEQAMVGIAAGFAKEGFYPIVHSISSFLLRRAYEQIYLDFGVQKLKGLFVGIGEYPKLGPTHCCSEDGMLAMSVPQMLACNPVHCGDMTPTEATDWLIRDAVVNKQLAYVRV